MGNVYKENMKKFECIKCGECCQTLKDGLLLRECETRFFPPSSIKDFPSSKNNAKIMTKMICPNYSSKRGCLIYKDRPLICRVYPFYFDSNSGEVSIDRCWHYKTGDAIMAERKQIKLLRKYLKIFVIPEIGGKNGHNGI